MPYALTIELDTETLEAAYPSVSFCDAYEDIRRTLAPIGFTWQHGSVYFGDKKINAVDCVLAAQALSRKHAWFKASVRKIRMLRIEEISDLYPAL